MCTRNISFGFWVLRTRQRDLQKGNCSCGRHYVDERITPYTLFASCHYDFLFTKFLLTQGDTSFSLHSKYSLIDLHPSFIHIGLDIDLYEQSSPPLNCNSLEYRLK